MKVLNKQDFKINRTKYFSLGYLKSFDIFGLLNKYNDVDRLGQIETYSYETGFTKVGNSLRKFINDEKRDYRW